MRIALAYQALCTMSSVPQVPPETIKKVAATRGHRVRRIDFFVFWNGGTTAGTTLGCGMLAVRVAVANFYGFLLKRLTLTTASPLTFVTRLPGWAAIPGHCRRS